ncbi:ATP-dependent Clp protease adapter ClpS [Serinibacter arcticus]|uniref:ATP-dependent Clp protease adapter protein ClpS n=1 Tax=Serinibacter arcticus TaxID=1655435 RepID=A0A2U1ZTD7_9MICO|nr:ATP-dependent Clp protease adapter ClpS [Serinibacter arcticus]PWD50193.1 ATP-dependent Clp protease adapter ClpS [Serinibacter arcticus]
MPLLGSIAPARAAVAPPETREQPVAAADVRPAPAWRTVVWDDPVNLMSYVTYVFRTHFGFSREKAEELMLQVHHAGRAVVAEGGRERMEAHVEALHTYGLWATLEKDTA